MKILDFSKNRDWIESEEMNEFARILWKIVGERCKKLQKFVIPKELTYSSTLNSVIGKRSKRCPRKYRGIWFQCLWVEKRYIWRDHNLGISLEKRIMLVESPSWILSLSFEKTKGAMERYVRISFLCTFITIIYLRKCCSDLFWIVCVLGRTMENN